MQLLYRAWSSQIEPIRVQFLYRAWSGQIEPIRVQLLYRAWSGHIEPIRVQLLYRVWSGQIEPIRVQFLYRAWSGQIESIRVQLLYRVCVKVWSDWTNQGPLFVHGLCYIVVRLNQSGSIICTRIVLYCGEIEPIRVHYLYKDCVILWWDWSNQEAVLIKARLCYVGKVWLDVTNHGAVFVQGWVILWWDWTNQEAVLIQARLCYVAKVWLEVTNHGAVFVQGWVIAWADSSWIGFLETA